MDESKAYITKLCEESIATMTSFKSESLEIISQIQQSTARVANLSDDHTARISLCEEELKAQKQKIVREAEKLEDTTDRVEKMEISKVEQKVSDHMFRKVTMMIKKLELVQEHSKNEMKSLENWVEKYQPLRLQNQICQSVGQVLPKKQRKKL